MMMKSGLGKILLKFLLFDKKYKFSNKNDMESAWRNFKNIFPRTLFIIIFKPEMLKFHPYSILTGDTRVEFVVNRVFGNIKQRFAVLKVSNINNHDGSNLVCIGKSNTWVNLVVGFLACFFTGRNTIFKETVGWLAIWAKFKTEPNVDAGALEANAFSFKN